MRGRSPIRPPRRARSLPWKEGTYVSLDFEATGLDFDRDRIISFGAVPIRAGRIEVGGARYQLVDPEDRAPSHGSVRIHGIRPVDLRGAPSIVSATTSLVEALDRRFMVAWHAGVEAAFLSKLFPRSPDGWLRITIDARDLLIAAEGKGAAGLTLTEAATHLGIPVSNPHHALDDALVTAQLFLVLATRLAQRDGPRSVGDLLRSRVEPPPVLRRPRAPA